jgi:hypothetical protein
MIVKRDIAQYRYDICKKCEKFITITKQCQECSCFLPAKVKFKSSYCPLKKWEACTVPE